MRGATARSGPPTRFTDISIHAPHARSDYRMALALFSISQFQSTLLMRGATCTHPRCRSLCSYFNPRSSCEERQDVMRVVRALFDDISIHAPHARSDCTAALLRPLLVISIHAPHARSDLLSVSPSRLALYFNPRSSCEERLYAMCM